MIYSNCNIRGGRGYKNVKCELADEKTRDRADANLDDRVQMKDNRVQSTDDRVQMTEYR